MDDRITRKLSDGTEVYRVYSYIAEKEVLVHDNVAYNLNQFPRILTPVHTGDDFDKLKALATLKRD